MKKLLYKNKKAIFNIFDTKNKFQYLFYTLYLMRIFYLILINNIKLNTILQAVKPYVLK
jgi:hypothetical protein